MPTSATTHTCHASMTATSALYWCSKGRHEYRTWTENGEVRFTCPTHGALGLYQSDLCEVCNRRVPTCDKMLGTGPCEVCAAETKGGAR